MSIRLDELDGDGLRRDRWGRLMVVPPGETEPVGYTRFTTVAKACDDGGGLVPWSQTNAVVGTLRHRGIRAKWEALMSLDPNPWYAGDSQKAKCKQLVAEAAKAGGSDDRRDLGTALHSILANVNRNESYRYIGDDTLPDLEAYSVALDAYGVDAIPDLVEQTVVIDSLRVGGTPDAIVNVRGRRLPMIADLKTGADLSYSWGSFCVQLAGYAHGESLYTQGSSPAHDIRAPMPEVDQDEGLIVWLPAGQARCELYVIDLRAGWEAFQLSLAVRAWRTRKGLATPFSQWTSAPRWPPGRRVWLQERINAIGRLADAQPATRLRELWPAGMPPLHRSDAHTDDELDQVAKLVDLVESAYSIPFGATDPSAPTPSPRHLFPTSPPTQEQP